MGSKWKNYSNWIKLAHFSILTPIWPLLAPFLESKWSQIRKSSFPMYFYSQKLCTHKILFKSDNFSILTPTWPPLDPHLTPISPIFGVNMIPKPKFKFPHLFVPPGATYSQNFVQIAQLFHFDPHLTPIWPPLAPFCGSKHLEFKICHQTQ